MPRPPHVVELRVEGEIYRGWTRGSVIQSLNQFASAFELEYVDQWSDEGKPWQIEEGDAIALLIDDEILLEGYVDEFAASYSAQTRALRVRGRSKLGDLLDCDAIIQGSQWRDASLSQILSDLCAPFGVEFAIFGSEGAKFRRHKFDPGDTVADIIQRVARLRGFTVADAGGRLELFKVEDLPPVDHFFRGWPTLRGERTGSMYERFSEYRFRGQTQADDETNGVAAARLKGRAEDRGVRRHRPKLILAGGADGDRDLGMRAIIERNRRAGRSESVSYSVPGFRTEEGELWRPGLGVSVSDDWLNVDGTMLVETVVMSFEPGDPGATEGGMVTDLQLTPPAAYGAGEYPMRERLQKLRSASGGK